MKFTFFVHSLVSCWNHGNAHFLRGIVRALQNAGHHVRVYEPQDSWSLSQLLSDQGEAGLASMRRIYPDLKARSYTQSSDFDALIGDSDVVIAHEWTAPWALAALSRARQNGRFLFLFHDTHHRAISDPGALHGAWMDHCDGILAFGASLAAIYAKNHWHDRIFVWHEAADTSVFKPPAIEALRRGLVFIGNWGDNERNLTLGQYLLRPAQASGSPLDVFGVRYPASACGALAAHGAHYRGFIANADVPSRFAHYRATVHVPRSFYVRHLPGIPTIRVFEALACGLPLLSAPWDDCETLFEPNSFIMAHHSRDMERAMQSILHDDDLWQHLSENGLRQIHARHSCDIRVAELLDIVARLRPREARVA